MKRRAMSFLTALALCLSLCPMRALAAGEDIETVNRVTQDTTNRNTYFVTESMWIDTLGNVYTGESDPAICIQNNSRVYLTYGTIQSTKGTGVELQAGCLYVDDSRMTIIGTKYGLDISSGATAELSGGTFTGAEGAIRLQGTDADYKSLLASTSDTHYAYFDESGKPIPLTDVAEKTTVVVKECTNHFYEYTPDTDVTTHQGVCVYCGDTASEECTFDFNADGSAECAKCDHTITITVIRPSSDPVYTGEQQPASPASVSVTVELDGKELTEDTDYTVANTSGKDTGEIITVTVTGKPNPWTFTKTFKVIKDTPEITWDTTDTDDSPYPLKIDYMADSVALTAKVKEALLQRVKIAIQASEDLSRALEFSYKEKNARDGGFSNGLPTDAGTYEIIASLPEQTNYKAVSSAPITLTINQINPIKENGAPAAKTLTYNSTAQELVTHGEVWDGAVILYALGKSNEDGTITPPADSDYSETIPTGTNAGEYSVWYKVEETNNYNGVDATKIEVEIHRKEITPDVKLEYTSHEYTGGALQPSVTVSDKDDGKVLPVTEYSVEYKNNTNVGGPKEGDDTSTGTVTDDDKSKFPTVTVSDTGDGNYDIETVTKYFTITPKDQAGLMITKTPDSVSYGDVFTLEASGGSGNGTITWEIISGTASTDGTESVTTTAKINIKSGQVTVTGVGTVTVQATKSDTDSEGNHKNATATWTFTAGKRHVVATVTAANKTYDGKTDATVTAVVPAQDIVSGDKIEIDDATLTGTFSTPDAGTNKIVTVTWAGALSGTGSENYIVTLSSTTVTADITKAATTVTAPTAATLTYSGTSQALLAESGKAVAQFTTEVDNTVTPPPVEYALGANGGYSVTIPQATNAGSYEVWYRVRETSNYFGTVAEKVVVTIDPKTVSDPTITLSQDSYVYDGTEKKPTVTVMDESDEIPVSEYTVTYSNNVDVGNAEDTDTSKCPTVTIKDNPGGNYTVSGTKTFTIEKAGAVLTSPPQAQNLTYNGNSQNLVTAGSATGGHLVYAAIKASDNAPLPADDDYLPTIPQEKDAGTYIVYYKVVGDSNYADTDPASVTVTISPKTVSNPVITLDQTSYVYDGTEKEPNVTVKDGETTIGTSVNGENSEYTVSYSDNKNAGTATVHIIDKVGGNYIINGEKTFEIRKAVAEFTDGNVPQAKTDLKYNGNPQDLVSPGETSDGTVYYSKDGTTFSLTVPTGTNAGNYTIWYKIIGDSNHTDSTPDKVNVKIAPKEVSNPTITLSQDSYVYDGLAKEPTVTVKDGDDVIPSSEYTVTFDPQQPKEVGTYTVTVTAKEGGNYTFTAASGEFNIVEASQAPLSIVTDMGPTVYYGDTFRLSAVGGSGTGKVHWSIDNANVATITEDGVVEVIGTGIFTVTAYREGVSDSYKESNTDSITFTAKAKPVTAVVTAKNKVYDGNKTAELSVTVPVTGITITVNSGVTGTFDTADVGTSKTVEFTITADHVNITGNGDENYAITYPGTGTTTASITPAPTSFDNISVTAVTESLTYNRTPQALVTVSGSATGGDLAYSLDGRNYDLNIPTATNAGTYTVRYKVLGDKNHTDSNVETVTVEIGKATPTINSKPIADPLILGQSLSESNLAGGRAICDGVEVPGTFTWTNGDDKPTAGRTQQNVTFTPTDKVNFTTATTMVTVEVISVDSDSESTPGTAPGNGTTTPTQSNTETPSTQTTVRDGTASTVVSDAAGNRLANEAVASQSDNVVIKPEITGDVTKAEVSLPASAVSRIGKETDASLTVSTPIADVTIPNGALSALSSAGGTVSVAAEQVDNTVVLSLTANGKDVGEIPGGLTLTVPMEDATPGTVAVLVYEDGTREIIRKSVAGDGGVRIPLNGSATVELVDNSKEFADVPAENWAADAVAFASAHEMFNGTSETTFSPEKSMSRAMLATVLYNLEGQPDQDLNSAFSDINGDAWYAESVSWAAENGIVTGYGNGSFGANDSITREQLAVMLWRYAGSPTAGKQSLDFTDASQVSSYAAEALCWAVANGILNGHGNGRIDPTGLATRAQAAQMLKNFMENT